MVNVGSHKTRYNQQWYSYKLYTQDLRRDSIMGLLKDWKLTGAIMVSTWYNYVEEVGLIIEVVTTDRNDHNKLLAVAEEIRVLNKQVCVLVVATDISVCEIKSIV